MKYDIGKWDVVVFMSFLMFGCSSIRARTETPDKEWTVYPGIQLDVKGSGELFGGKSSEPDWIKGVMATIYIVDLPFSTVFDTVVMPYDLYRITPRNTSEKADNHRNNPQRDKRCAKFKCDADVGRGICTQFLKNQCVRIF